MKNSGEIIKNKPKLPLKYAVKNGTSTEKDHLIMQLPSIDRLPSSRPVGADGVSSGANKVIPVLPVNPSSPASAIASADTPPPPGVINLVNQVNKPSAGEAVYTSVSDPARRGSEAATSAKDWTIHRPEPEKVVVPPPEPISKLLMDFLRTMWRASGSAVEATLAENQAQNMQINPSSAPGDLAKLNLVYSAAKVSKTEKSLSGDSPSGSTTP